MWSNPYICVQHYSGVTGALRVSIQLQLDSLLNSLFRLKSKTISNIRISDPLWAECINDHKIPIAKASNVESVSMPWRHHDDYRKVSNIRRTKFQNISDSPTVLHVVFAQFIEAMY